MIKDLDSNSDGIVTKEELLAGVEKFFIGKDYLTVPRWAQVEGERLFEVLDVNKNGELSFEEVSTFSKKSGSNASNTELRHAYDYAKNLGGGIFDKIAFRKLLFVWASSPDPVPEFDVLIPFFK